MTSNGLMITELLTCIISAVADFYVTFTIWPKIGHEM